MNDGSDDPIAGKIDTITREVRTSSVANVTKCFISSSLSSASRLKLESQAVALECGSAGKAELAILSHRGLSLFVHHLLDWDIVLILLVRGSGSHDFIPFERTIPISTHDF